MNEHYAEIEKEEERNIFLTDEILKPLREEKSEEWFKELTSYAEESGTHYPFEIVTKPLGKWQEEEEYPLLNGVWVEQSSSYGCEDCYYGTVTVKIDDNRYLEMPFNC